ncbi:MAG: glycosyltransferase family 1 protein [Thiomicrorhabdus sp.]|nr:glycosyltransferase family 1 protein [Thiomicrorhabdus sp.]
MKNHNLDTHTIKRLTLVTDAWFPQVNGVVTTLSNLVNELTDKGMVVDVIQPNDYANFPLPSYPEIRCVWRPKGLTNRILNFKPDAIHIATEGSLGWFARHIAIKHGLPFTSGYHTRYPEYIRARYPMPMKSSYAVLRYFHKAAQRTLVPAESIMHDLEAKGFKNLHLMSRGVNTRIFNPEQHTLLGYPKPILLYVGRVAPEKNIEAFLTLDYPGSKLIIGDGPQRKALQKKYPEAIFLGVKKGSELARYYASADTFVFPSKTDTFGVVIIESIACGTPVAAYPVTGPQDIITEGLNGATDNCLKTAITKALTLPRKTIAVSIPQYTWEHAVQQFITVLAPINWHSSQTSTPKDTLSIHHK